VHHPHAGAEALLQLFARDGVVVTPTLIVTPTPTPTPTPADCPVAGEVPDVCGVCGPPRNGSALQDCAGDCLGTAAINVCGNCVGGSTGHPPTLGQDVCLVCGGNGTTCLGCDGLPFSNATVDYCAVCGGNNTDCIVLDHVAPPAGLNLPGAVLTVLGAGLADGVGGAPRTVQCVVGNGTDGDTATVVAMVLSVSEAQCTLPAFNLTGTKEVRIIVGGVTAPGMALYTVLPPITCPPAAYGNATWPQTIANTTASGTCDHLFFATGGAPPTRACSANGTWSTAVDNACTRPCFDARARVFFPSLGPSNLLFRMPLACFPFVRVCVCVLGTAGLTCATESFGGITWPTALAPSTATGVCPGGFALANGITPTRACTAAGTWAGTYASSCVRTYFFLVLAPQCAAAWLTRAGVCLCWMDAEVAATDCAAPLLLTMPAPAAVGTTVDRPVAIDALLSVATACPGALANGTATFIYLWTLTSRDTPPRPLSAAALAALNRTGPSVDLPAGSLRSGQYRVQLQVSAVGVPNANATGIVDFVMAAVAPVARLTRGGSDWLVPTTSPVVLNGADVCICLSCLDAAADHGSRCALGGAGPRLALV
jgi:hypothetical protein